MLGRGIPLLDVDDAAVDASDGHEACANDDGIVRCGPDMERCNPALLRSSRLGIARRGLFTGLSLSLLVVAVPAS